LGRREEVVINRRWLIPGGVALLALALAWTIGVAPRLAGSVARPAGLATSTGPVGSSEPYRLYIHCGYEFAEFAGRYWRQVVPQPQDEPRVQPRAPHSDGVVPGTFDPNFSDGTMTWVATDRIRFRSADGQIIVDFVAYDGHPPGCD
jgi:hypothetical protein